MADVGDKIRSMIVKLQETHRKEKSSIFTEEGEMIQSKTLPKKAIEIKSYFNYMAHDRWKNVSLVLHMMSPKSFQDFKNPICTWLQMNKYYINKTIFKSSKDMAVCIGHITNMNPFQIDCTQYQESINLLMERSAQEKVAANKKYFE
eukprot:5628886-Ditylum_brightwellii.AAC.1